MGILHMLQAMRGIDEIELFLDEPCDMVRVALGEVEFQHVGGNRVGPATYVYP